MKNVLAVASILLCSIVCSPVVAQSAQQNQGTTIRIRGSFDFTIELSQGPPPSDTTEEKQDTPAMSEEEFFADGEALQCMIFNVESDDNDPAVIAQRIEAFNGAEVWGLSEVKAENAERYFLAASKDEGASFAKILGETGRNDRLMVIYNSERLELIESRPMSELSNNGRHRAPLAVHFRDTRTAKEFWFINNHLARGDASSRNRQATALRDFALAEPIPVIVCGDLNLDYSTIPGKEKGNTAFRTLIGPQGLHWVETPRDIWTNSHPDFLSILDYYLVNKLAEDSWQMQAMVFTEEGDEEDTPLISDHRPVGLSLRLKTPSP